MKKITYTVILLLAMIATACSASNQSNRSSNRQNGSSTGALPPTTQLIIGTLKLEGTDQAVTAKQAADLLPLWQTMKVLSTSDTAAAQEKEALVAQIQGTMTAEQMKAITAMNLTRSDMFAFMQEQGAGPGGTPTVRQNSNSQNGNSSNGNRRNSGQGGGGFGGPPPGGGFGGPGGGFGGQGQNTNRTQIATAQASRQQTGSFIPPALLNGLIEYLQKKAGL